MNRTIRQSRTMAPKRPKPKSAVTSSPTTRRSRNGRPRHDDVPAALNAPPLAPPAGESPLGLYLHIPFCRKRCKFCYFRVYTDKNGRRRRTLRLGPVARNRTGQQAAGDGRAAVSLRLLWRRHAVVPQRQATHALVDRLRANINWDQAEEVTFECEPGTLSEPKVHTLRELGVTRLSLGVENFSDDVLEENGRAHLSRRGLQGLGLDSQPPDFPNVNIDLISGMVGETWDNWKDSVRQDDRTRRPTA